MSGSSALSTGTASVRRRRRARVARHTNLCRVWGFESCSQEQARTASANKSGSSERIRLPSATVIVLTTSTCILFQVSCGTHSRYRSTAPACAATCLVPRPRRLLVRMVAPPASERVRCEASTQRGKPGKRRTVLRASSVKATSADSMLLMTCVGFSRTSTSCVAARPPSSSGSRGQGFSHERGRTRGTWM
jgi:hypothetical protein